MAAYSLSVSGGEETVRALKPLLALKVVVSFSFMFDMYFNSTVYVSCEEGSAYDIELSWVPAPLVKYICPANLLGDSVSFCGDSR